MPAPEVPHLREHPDAASALARAKVLYTDLDATLLGRGGSVLRDDRGEPHTEAAEAIVALAREGLEVVMVSGRNVRQLTELCRVLGWNDFMAELGAIRAYERGARIVHDLGEWPVDAIAHKTPFGAITDAGAVELLEQAFPGRIEYHTPYHVDRDTTHVLRGQVDLPEAQRLLDGLPLPVVIVDNGLIHPRAHTLHDVERVHVYHLLPRGVSKRGAILADLAERGLGPADAIAVGDSPADLPMAEAVAFLGIVANGLDSPVLREAAPIYPNVAHTTGRAGRGWAEFAHAWLKARRSLG